MKVPEKHSNAISLRQIVKEKCRTKSESLFRIQTILLFVVFCAYNVRADKLGRLRKKANKASAEFAMQASMETTHQFKVDTFIVNPENETLNLRLDPTFSYLPFRPENTSAYYNLYSNLLGRKYRKYKLTIESMGKEISELIPNYYRSNLYQIDSSRLGVPGKLTIPIVRNSSKNDSPNQGLNNRNIALWHSHGWYYEYKLDRWEWQRARDFLTVEDIWTMSFVVPYITPMLENAGANVFLPRERDVQNHEIIVDADGSTNGSVYREKGTAFQEGNEPGFGLKVPFLFDGENPFKMGESRKMPAKSEADSRIIYTPEIPDAGEYAVFISYLQNADNVTDAHYSVNHSGGKTEFLVNQRMGGGTWIYLGTFRFEKGLNSEIGSIELTNQSTESGKWISADAVRFGGGIGNIVRGRKPDMDKLRVLRDEQGFELDTAKWLRFSSQRPRYQEGARYYLQYAGMPDSLVYNLNQKKTSSPKNEQTDGNLTIRDGGSEDYKDDYQCRGQWVNYLVGAANDSNAKNTTPGLNVPIDLSLAFHTDAGTIPDSAIVGSLMIYDTTFGPDHFPNGQSRWASRDLADIVQTQVVSDLQKLYEPEWTRRGMWNKQYSEAARPKVPAILSELLSHQNFADMMQANDPRFKFDVCRAFYKGILKFIAFQNGFEYVVQPLPVDHFQMTLENLAVRLSWQPVQDKLEPTANEKKYRVYTRIENGGFDNGVEVVDPTFLGKDLKPGVIYSFKITAVNEGGESFPSEILACSIPIDDKKPNLIVNAFDRISGPEAFDNGNQAGFFTPEDEGVAYKTDLSFIGEQYDFDRNSPWRDDDASGFGSSHADQETRMVQGNSFDYPVVHGKAFRNNGFGFISMSDESFEEQKWNGNEFSALDVIFGEEKTTKRLYGFPKKDFILFTPEMQAAITKYSEGSQAKMFLSGAYIGTDLDLCGDTLARNFAANVLHFRFRTNHASKSGCIYPVNEMRNQFSDEFQFVQSYDPHSYKVESPDAIEPFGEYAKVLFRYKGDNKTSGVCYNGKYQTIVLGFPFETIKTKSERNQMVDEILKFWELK